MKTYARILLILLAAFFSEARNTSVLAFNLLDKSFCWMPPIYPSTYKVIPVYMNPNYNPSIIPIADQIAAVTAAINTWNQALLSDGANTQFEYEGICEVVNFTNDQHCDIFFANSDTIGYMELAWTQPFPFIGHMEDNQESDIAIYTYWHTYAWVETILPPPPSWPPEGVYDLESLVLHELGHVLGLDNVGQTAPVMYGHLASGPAGVKRELHIDDKTGVWTIYNFTASIPEGQTPGAPLVTGQNATFGWINLPNSDLTEIGFVQIMLNLHWGFDPVWEMLATSVSPAPGYWTTPNGLTGNVTSSCSFRVRSARHIQIYDETSGFPIYGFFPYCPMPGTTWVNGRTYTIRWNTLGDYGNVDVLYGSGPTWTPISELTNIANTNAGDWHIPFGLVEENLQIRVQSHEDPTIFGLSEPFNIIQNFDIRVIYPNGGEEWVVGEHENIIWEFPYISVSQLVNIILIHDGEQTLLHQNWPGMACRYELVVPNIISNRCIIRVIDAVDPSRWDDSDYFFKIISQSTPPPSQGYWYNIWYNCLNFIQFDPTEWWLADLDTRGGSTNWGIICPVQENPFYAWSSKLQEGQINLNDYYYDYQHSVLEYLVPIPTDQYKMVKFKFQCIRNIPSWDDDYLIVSFHDGLAWYELGRIYGPSIIPLPPGWEQFEYLIDRSIESFRFKFEFVSDFQNVCPSNGYNYYDWFMGVMVDEPSVFGYVLEDETAGDDLTKSIENTLPRVFSLSQNAPNPFNVTTIVRFELPKASDVKLDVFNISGRKITTLIDEFLPPGYHQVNFDGSSTTSGIYFYRIEAGSHTSVKKMLLIK